ncbi:hypothetical protein HQ585_04465 [candidate division KSB1 bacterium]|nr:hypothetical protein [candidate division KSB1 bacterium]
MTDDTKICIGMPMLAIILVWCFMDYRFLLASLIFGASLAAGYFIRKLIRRKKRHKRKKRRTSQREDVHIPAEGYDQSNQSHYQSAQQTYHYHSGSHRSKL